MRHFRNKDKIRVLKAAKKISITARIRRQKLRSSKKSKEKQIINYAPGAFGLTKNPESFDVEDQTMVKSVQSVEITFVADASVMRIHTYLEN